MTNSENEIYIYVIKKRLKFGVENRRTFYPYPYKFNLNTNGCTIPSDIFFGSKAKLKIYYKGIDNKEIISISDIESIKINIHYDGVSNKSKKKKEIKKYIDAIIKKRSNEINELKKERNEINEKIENCESSEDDMKKMYKDIEMINYQIKNHNIEIKKIKDNLKENEIEIGDEQIDYNFILYPNKIEHINNLPDQLTNLSLIWLSDDKFETKVDPVIETINIKKINLSYEDLDKI